MQTIKLDLQRQLILTPLKAKQNDRYSRFFKVVLLDGSTAFSIPSGAALTVRYIAPTGSGWYDTITEIDNTTTHSAFAISGNEVTVELAEATLTKPGNGMLCLQIYTATGYRIGTWNIPLEIEADPLADSTIAASDYYNVLTGQVAQALGYRDAAANSATAAAASAALAQQISQQSKGWYATSAALIAAWPTGQNGWWAIVGAGDNIWTWDADTSSWVNTHQQTDLSNYYTKTQADAAFAPILTGCPTGSLMPFAGAAAPTGWLLANGAAVSRATYAALFTVIGTAYGAGDGSTTFNLPNMAGRVPVGCDANLARGATEGARSHVQTVDEMPNHAHIYTKKGGDALVIANGSTYGYRADDEEVNTSWVGGNQPMSLMQPSIGINYIIKT